VFQGQSVRARQQGVQPKQALARGVLAGPDWPVHIQQDDWAAAEFLQPKPVEAY